MYTTNQAIGKFIVTVNKAILTYDACTFGKMDPYFVCLLTSVKSYRSKAKKDEGKHPMWMETFALEYAGEQNLSINIYHDKEFVKFLFLNSLNRSLE
jgi:Ca2+-dependent lipid-binding protein